MTAVVPVPSAPTTTTGTSFFPVYVPNTQDAKSGLRVWNQYGKIVYDSNMVTWNQFAAMSVPRNSSANQVAPSTKLGQYITLTFFTEDAPIDRRAVAPTVSVNSGRITVGGSSESTLTIGLAR